MGKRRFAQVATSDEEEEQEQEEEEPRRSKASASASASASREKRRDKKKKKKIKGGDDDDDDDGGAVVEEEEEFSSEPEEPERENVQEDAKVIGDVIKVTGKGKRKKNHYSSFEFDGNVFELVIFFLFPSFHNSNHFNKLSTWQTNDY